MLTPNAIRVLGYVSEAAATTCPSSWVPEVVGRDGDLVTFRLDDGSVGTSRGLEGALGEAYSYGLLHMLHDPARHCKLFSCPLAAALGGKDGNVWAPPCDAAVDVVVGFADSATGRLYPATPSGPYVMVGRRPPHLLESPPPGTDTVVCACLSTFDRGAIVPPPRAPAFSSRALKRTWRSDLR